MSMVRILYTTLIVSSFLFGTRLEAQTNNYKRSDGDFLPDSLENYLGVWFGVHGDDSLVIDIKADHWKFSEILDQADVEFDSVHLVGTYELYKNGKLVTGNHKSESLSLAHFRNTNKRLFTGSICDRGCDQSTARFGLKLKLKGQNRILWQLLESQEVIIVRTQENPQVERVPIDEFILPKSLKLTKVSDGQ
jgi:hypothetical protein